jgi:2'-hydroxyisoflavone reductase
MNLLIIGGTRFVGRHLVEAALARSHTVTLFNRGQSNPDLFPHVERLQGDRDRDLSALQHRTWDAVIDTCGYVPRCVRRSAEMLTGAVDRYVFISTVSVYAEDNPPGMDENSPLAHLADESVDEVTGETYGGLKVLCENVVTQVCTSERSLIIRPGLIVGPHDPTDRFTYWPQRIARGGEVLAPGNPDQPVQIIDGRDLTAWIVRLIEMRQSGVYNAVGPEYLLTMQHLLEECVATCNPSALLTWVSEEFLLSRGVTPWSELPVWVPEKEAAFDTTSNAKAIAAGLRFRPLSDIMRDTLTWSSTRSASHAWRAGLNAERESELLHAWHARAQ